MVYVVRLGRFLLSFLSGMQYKSKGRTVRILHKPGEHRHPSAEHEHGAGEGVRVGGVHERGAGAGVPGGGRRRVRDRPGRLPCQGAQGPRPPRQKPVRTGPGVPGRGSHALPVPCNLTLRAPQAQDRRGQPIEGRRPQGIGARRRLDGRGGAQLRHRHALGLLPAPRRAGAGQDPRREDHRREHREAEDGAGRVRGPAEQAQVPGRRFPEPRGPQPLPRDALLHGDALRGGTRRVPSCQGLAGGAVRQARRQEGHLAHGQGLPVIMSNEASHFSMFLAYVPTSSQIFYSTVCTGCSSLQIPSNSLC